MVSDRVYDFEVSSGALVIASNVPCGCDIGRDSKNDIIWLPKLLVAIPQKDNPFVVSHNIRLKNTPYYITRENPRRMSIWHADPDVQKTLKLRGYIFAPGKSRADNSLPLLYVFEKSFVPDIKDPNQNCENINVLGGFDNFDYADGDHNISFLLNPRIGRELLNAVYASTCAITYAVFGYDCVHTAGGYGLNSRKDAKFDASSEQIRCAVGAIQNDLEAKLGV